MQSFKDAYRGEWDSLRDHAENYAEEVGMYAATEKSGFSYGTVDIDAPTRDLDIDIDIELYPAKSDHSTIHVFDPTV